MTRYFLRFINILILTNISFLSNANDKILLIGDSLSAGYGLEQEQAWVHLLQNKYKAQAIKLLDKVGLSHRLGHYPSQLSGGEQQRVAIARAFIGSPKILFADEPSANLDSKNGHLIEKLLFDLNQQNGTTLILVTHDEQLAKKCKRIIHIEGGQLEKISEGVTVNVG